MSKPLALDQIPPNIQAGSFEPVSLNSPTSIIHLAVGAPGSRRIVCGVKIVDLRDPPAIYPRPDFEKPGRHICTACVTRYQERLAELRLLKKGSGSTVLADGKKAQPQKATG